MHMTQETVKPGRSGATVASKSVVPLRLLADIGGTNARFALEVAPAKFSAIVVFQCAHYASLQDALQAYFQLPHVRRLTNGRLAFAALAIATAVDGDKVGMTNHHWQFSIEDVRRKFGLERLVVVNDFQALAMSIPSLAPRQKRKLGGGLAKPSRPIGLLGAGTGLGVAALVPTRDRWIAIDTEGGHMTFAPSDEREVEILQYAWREYPHVSAERFMSGIGLELMARALAKRARKRLPPMTVPEILQKGLSKECAICDETIEAFCAMLGTFAGNIAVGFGTRGGVYIGGGIVPRLGERFMQSEFRSRFEQKGRFSDYLAKIPTFVITAKYPAFMGASHLLNDALND